jgi:integral membrane sensor domain MASE1
MTIIEARHDPGWISSSGKDAGAGFRLAFRQTWSIAMSEVDLVSSAGPQLVERLSFAQQEVLERAVAKIVLMGELVGVSADQMILLLESGLTVTELLEYLGLRTRQSIIGRPRLELVAKG